MNKFSLILLTFFLLSNIAVAGTLDEGMTAYQAGDYIKAYQTLLPLAKKNNADAQYYIGGMFADGLGVPQNSGKAVRWLDKAVKNNHKEAAVFLGKMYLSGRGVPLDPQKGAYYISLSDAKEAEAQQAEETESNADEECD